MTRHGAPAHSQLNPELEVADEYVSRGVAKVLGGAVLTYVGTCLSNYDSGSGTVVEIAGAAAGIIGLAQAAYGLRKVIRLSRDNAI